MAKKHYTVWEGREKGVFDAWEKCKSSTDGYQGANFKSFSSYDEALEAFKKGYERSNENTKDSSDFIEESVSVDSSASKAVGKVTYRGVYTKTGEVIFERSIEMATNNIGEFLAIVHILALQVKQHRKFPVYSDSITAISWVMGKKVNTSLAQTPETRETWDLIHRAEKWLRENVHDIEILKWDTRKLGEIRADYGNK